MRYFILLAALLLAPLTAQAGYEECEYFENGGFVRSKLSGLKGMVVSHWRTAKENEEPTPGGCRFSVRFVTESGWVYTIEKMRPYELEKWKDRPELVRHPRTAGDPKDYIGNLDFGQR